MSHTMLVLGLDGCPRGWIAIILRDARFDRALFAPTLREILAAEPAAAVVGIDIPIGFEADRFRRIDAAAKAFVGPRRSSVFETPPAGVLEEPTHDAAVARSRRLAGKGLSRQSYALREKILEVGPAAAADPRIIEVHPEVSFCALHGAHLAAAKSNWAGHEFRRQLVRSVGIELPSDLGEAGRQGTPDDVLDAAVVAWTADRHARGESVCLEPRVRDASGREIGIWY